MLCAKHIPFGTHIAHGSFVIVINQNRFHMTTEELTLEKLPKAVAYLIKEIEKVKSLLENQKTVEPEKRRPIDIGEASKIINKAIPTIYTLVRKRQIPCYKNGKRLYFYEDELLEWIALGKRKSSIELRAEMEKEMSNLARKKPRSFNI